MFSWTRTAASTSEETETPEANTAQPTEQEDARRTTRSTSANNLLSPLPPRRRQTPAQHLENVRRSRTPSPQPSEEPVFEYPATGRMSPEEIMALVQATCEGATRASVAAAREVVREMQTQQTQKSSRTAMTIAIVASMGIPSFSISDK